MPQRILIVDDSPEVRQVLRLALRGEEYDLATAADGREALTSAFADPPDLILLDVNMPALDGIEVCRRLKSDLSTHNIPIIMLTGEVDPERLVEALEAGADDYVRKPCDTLELRARVRAQMRRTERYVGTDPLTKLPGNKLLRQELADRLSAGRHMAVCYLDIDHFKVYVDTYGFEAASRVIQELARIGYNAMVEHGGLSDYIGHIGGDDFLLITTPDRAANLCEAIIADFEARRDEFYSPEDRARGCLHGHDRQGVERDFPLMTLSIAVLLPHRHDIVTLDSLATAAARLKHQVKAVEGSAYRVG